MVYLVIKGPSYRGLGFEERERVRRDVRKRLEARGVRFVQYDWIWDEEDRCLLLAGTYRRREDARWWAGALASMGFDVGLRADLPGEAPTTAGGSADPAEEPMEDVFMSGQKKGMWVVFRMENLPTKDELRRRFCELYHIYRDHPGIESKCWWVNEEKGEWGAFYIFESEEILEAYLRSDLWVKEIPGRWGLKPEATIVDPGPVLSKRIITQAEDSWVTK